MELGGAQTVRRRFSETLTDELGLMMRIEGMAGRIFKKKRVLVEIGEDGEFFATDR